MEEKDFQRIEQLIGKAVKAEVGKAVKAEIESVTEDMRSVRSDVSGLKEGMAVVRSDVGSVKEEVKAVREEIGSFKDEIKKDFRLQVGILSEDFQHKLQLVAEGHQMLSEKMDRMQGEIGEIKDTVTAVAADLAAHRADTEGHKRGYMVKEP
jgi:peptidoglycan hydrolase CwlO-like protein